jgi:CPA2 family monovalent cation:H+ antiporter-2
MAVEPLFFLDLAYVFSAAVVGAVLAWWTRQPLIIGYVVGGILIGPFTPGPVVSDFHTFELFAEIGVILLMFSIGIEFSLRDLLRVKWVAILGGPLGIVLSGGLSLLVGKAVGWPPLQAIVIGAVISVASTMVLARLLLDRGELHAPHGRVMIGITLVEDLAVVILTVLLPALGTRESGRLATIGWALLTGTLILVPFSYLAAKVIPRAMARVAGTRNDELFLIVALAIALGTAALTQAVGLSLALGAFLAGMLISYSDYAHETLARLLPLRDAFVALFFVTVGALVDPIAVIENPGLLLAILGLIIVGKFLVWTAVVWLFRYPLRTAALVGVGLTQIGEFSFILVQVARSAGHVGSDVQNATLAASLISILLNALLVRYVPDWLAARERRVAPASAPASIPLASPGDHVVLCGAGRVGGAIGEALETFEVPFTIVERDPHRIEDLRRRGRPCIFGDAGQRDVLRSAGIERAQLVIVALPELAPALRAVQAARALSPAATILARAHGRGEADQLRHAGATEVIQPEVEASATLIRHALTHLQLPKTLTTAYLERYRDAVLEGREGRDPGEPADTPMPEVREVRIGCAGLADQTLREAAIRERFGVTVVAVLRGADLLLNPAPETRLRAGDAVRVFGLADQIEAFTEAATRERDGHP